jgi:hypothetical protein
MRLLIPRHPRPSCSPRSSSSGIASATGVAMGARSVSIRAGHPARARGSAPATGYDGRGQEHYGAEYPRSAFVTWPDFVSCVRRVATDEGLSPKALATSPAVEPGCERRCATSRSRVSPRRRRRRPRALPADPPPRGVTRLEGRPGVGTSRSSAASAASRLAASCTNGRNSAMRASICFRISSTKSGIARSLARHSGARRSCRLSSRQLAGILVKATPDNRRSVAEMG